MKKSFSVRFHQPTSDVCAKLLVFLRKPLHVGWTVPCARSRVMSRGTLRSRTGSLTGFVNWQTRNTIRHMNNLKVVGSNPHPRNQLTGASCNRAYLSPAFMMLFGVF